MMTKSVDRAAIPGVGNGNSRRTAVVPARSPWGRPVAVGAEPDCAPSVALSGVVSADWETLFGAVRTRLGQRARESAAPADAPGRDAAGPLRAIAQECAAALDQLQASLVHELGPRQQLELELFDARTALAQARERRARHGDLHEALTSLPDRTHFRQRLDDALASGEPLRKPLTVPYLDLDDFKPINDRHGHEVGDEVLRIIGARLARAVRASDVVGRIGGDEFACLLADLPGRQQLSQLACKFFDAVSAPVKVGRLQLNVWPSIGIAVFPTDGANTDELLRSADAAMQAAKRDRSGYAFFACDRFD